MNIRPLPRGEAERNRNHEDKNGDDPMGSLRNDSSDPLVVKKTKLDWENVLNTDIQRKQVFDSNGKLREVTVVVKKSYS